MNRVTSATATNELTGLEGEIASVGPADFSVLERCASDAQRAVVGLWDPTLGTFWRSTEQRSREGGQSKPKSSGNRKKRAPAQFYPTVSLRCTESLVSYALDCPEWGPKDFDSQLREIVGSVRTRRRNTLQSTLNSGAKLNVFTLAFFVRAHVAIQRREGAEANPDPELAAAITELVNHPTVSGDGSHPFLLFHAVRALAVAKTMSRSPLQTIIDKRLAKIRLPLRGAVERLLAKQRLGADTPSDAVALGFCAAALLVEHTREDIPYATAALSACLNAQDSNGCWPLGRVVHEQKDIASDRLEIPTHEIAEALADASLALLRSVHGEQSAIVAKSMEHLRRAVGYAERGLVRLDDARSEPRAGWSTEHAYGAELVESWTSATVLSAVISIRRLLEELRRREILASFTTVSPTDRDWPGWLRWEAFRATGETDHDHPILTFLERQLVRPIQSDPRQLPPTDPRSVSVLLFGPPGTSKTTIVKAIADALGWPVIMLSPGNFIEKGLEYIEVQARSVFDRLLELSKAVVIFDECDELFRDRAPRKDTEQTRGITAFVTASMLPKLQELHDRGRVVFFICTNHFEAIDPAVKRGGRIDHVIGVGPPDEAARQRIIEAAAKGSKRAHLAAAMDELAGASDRFNRSELQRAVRQLLGKPQWTTAARAKADARAVVSTLHGSLTISTEEYAAYKELQKQFSHPMLEQNPDADTGGGSGR